MHWRAPVVIALALVGPFFAACGGGGDEGDAPDRSSVGQGGQLRIAMPAEPRTLNSLYDTDSMDVYNRNVYETLVGRDADLELQPLLAESWELQGRSWVFELRRGVKFHDGSTMTAEDVVGSFNRVLDPKFKSPFRESFLGGVKSVKAVDDDTVRITSETADPSMPARTTMITIAPSEWTAEGDDRLDSAMMGTGPYKFVEWARGREITLARNDEYWGEPGRFRNVRIVFRPEDSVRLDALRAGEVDIAHGLPADIAQQAEKVASGPLSEVMNLRMTAAPGNPLADQRLRQAVNYAIDRQAIIEGLYQGEATPAKGQIVIPSVLGANPDLEDYPHDPERARQLVEEAGATGTKLSMAVPSGRWTKDREIGQALVGMLNEVGFQVEARFEEPTQWAESAFAPIDAPKAPDLLFIGHSNDLLDSYFTFSVNSICDGPLTAFCDRELTRMVEQGAAELELEQRAETFRQVWQLIYDKAYYAPIAVPNQTHGIAEELEWQPRPQIYMLFAEVQPAG
jgi:peptide/nickel transport system substrate-binding protein